MTKLGAKITIAVCSAIIAIAVFIVFLSHSGSDPEHNDHARACVNSGGSIHEKSQFGGKYSTYTWWCVNSDGQITDIWFD